MVCIFGACPVQISVVGAHSPFVIGLFDHNDVGEPGGKPNLFDEVCMEELVDFFFDSFKLLFSHLPFHLLYRFGLGTDSQFVADYARIDP